MPANKESIRISGITVDWDDRRKSFSLGKLPAPAMWPDSTLAAVLSRLQKVLGNERFALLLQSEGRKNIEAEWKIISKFSQFEEGVQAIANIAADLGWGHWEIVTFDRVKKELVIRIKDSWEGNYQKALGICWGSGMLAGKMAGYCSKLFLTNCWAEQISYIAKGDEYDTFYVKPSEKKIEQEIDNLFFPEDIKKKGLAASQRKSLSEEQTIITDKSTNHYSQQELEIRDKDSTQRLKEVTKQLQQKILQYENSNKALLDIEIRFREMFDNMSNCVAVYEVADNGSDFIFKDFNKAAEKVEGVRREDIIGKNILQIFPGVKKFGLFDVLRKVWQTGVPMQHPISFYEDKRLVGWRENFVYKLPGGEVVAIYEDVTSRKQAEKSLRESEKKYRDLLENLTQKIFHKDINSVYVACNRSYARELKIEPDEIAGTTDYDYYPKELAEKYIKDDKRIIESGQGEFNIVERYVLDGAERWVQTVKTPMKNEAGQVIGVLGIFHDITDVKKIEDEKASLEAQLRQAHKMEAIGTLAGGIAHDFNNILNIILGYADMAKEDIPDRSSARYSIDEVLKAGERAKELVRQILAFSRKTGLNKVPVQMHLLVNEVCNFLRATIPTNIEIKINIDPRSGRILADPTQIHQVLLNLCTNAAQAMEADGGSLSIGLGEAEVTDSGIAGNSSQKPGPYVWLSVTDSGVGIDEADIDRIYEPYFTTKGVGEGSGMGLAVVHGIVFSHEGFINVESTPGKGTTFKLFFPRFEVGGMPEQNQQKANLLPGGKERIVVVDDEKSIATLIQKRLEKLGYTVTAKTDSRDVLDLFLSDPQGCDLVITDQSMPKMTGERLARELMRIRPDIPIILSTGYSSNIDADKSASLGIKAFLVKPVSKEELAKTVRRVLDEG